jgi:hypothetical protein
MVSLVQKSGGDERNFNEMEGREGEEKSFNYLYVWFKRREERGCNEF